MDNQISKTRFFELMLFSATMAAAIGANAALFFTPPAECVPEEPIFTPEQAQCDRFGYGAPIGVRAVQDKRNPLTKNQVIVDCDGQV